MVVYDRWRFNPAVIPIFVFSAVTVIVYGAGLLNIMPLMIKVIFLIGLLSAFYYIYLSWKRKVNIISIFTPSTVIFLISLVIILLSLRGVISSHYDDFSHWGLIIKEMFNVNGLPDGRTTVDFKNYPPGSATFIYFVLSIVGYAESYALMAQAFLISSALTVLFIFSKWSNPGRIVITLVTAITLLSHHGTYIYTLLVDGLLGFVSLAIIIIAFYYRTDWRKSLAVNAPILILLILIKDSGKIFFLMNICVILWFVIKNLYHDETIEKKRSKAIAMSVLIVLVLPLSFNFLWGKYVDKVYQGYNYNKFAITSGNILNVDKSEEFIENLGPMLLESSINLDSPGIKSLLILNCLAIATILCFALLHKKISKQLIASMIYVNTAYFFYIMSLFLMYLLLMPENEAERLAGFGRYLATITIYCSGILMVALSNVWTNESTSKKRKIVKGICLVVMGILFFYPLGDNFKNMIKNKPNLEESIRWKIKGHYHRLINAQASGSHVLYYSPKSFEDRGYLEVILKYEQLNRHYSVIRSINTDDEINVFHERLDTADYVVIVDEDEHSEAIISGHMSGRSKHGIYKVVKINEGEIILQPL